MAAVMPNRSGGSSNLAEVVVDLGAIRRNVEVLGNRVGTETMVVVKADGYGHGMVPVARAAREAGARWLGAATHHEALALRAAGDVGRILTWLAAPDCDYRPLIKEDVDVTASTPQHVERIAMAARDLGVRARLQLKFDTGMSRGGAAHLDWTALIEAAIASHQNVTGVWSHLACADHPEHPANTTQEEAFSEAVAMVRASGLDPEVCHLANSAGALLRPTSRWDLVRLGIAAYGLSPAPLLVSSDDLGITPAMTVSAQVVLAKTIPEGSGVSYGHHFVAPRAMRVGLIPLGYGDGVPRAATSRAAVLVADRLVPVLGTVCMDQFVVGPIKAQEGDRVVLWGPGTNGEPTAQDWADWCDTIAYEIITRMHGRAHRRWVDV